MAVNSSANGLITYSLPLKIVSSSSGLDFAATHTMSFLPPSLEEGFAPPPLEEDGACPSEASRGGRHWFGGGRMRAPLDETA